MLAIGRALMSRPKLLALDEPSMGLAPIVARKIFEVIRDINRDGVTVLPRGTECAGSACPCGQSLRHGKRDDHALGRSARASRRFARARGLSGRGGRVNIRSAAAGNEQLWCAE